MRIKPRKTSVKTKRPKRWRLQACAPTVQLDRNPLLLRRLHIRMPTPNPHHPLRSTGNVRYYSI